METNLVTIRLSFEYGDNSKLHISNSSLDGANISEVDLYYIGKELERYGKELSRSVSRVESIAGNNGKFITIIRNKLVSIIYRRIINYIDKVDADMKDGYIKLYTHQMIMMLVLGSQKSSYYKGLNKKLKELSYTDIVFDLIDEPDKRQFITREEYNTLKVLLSSDNLDFIDKYLKDIYDCISMIPKKNKEDK